MSSLLLLLAGCEEDGSDSSIKLHSGSVVELYPVANQTKTLTIETKADWTATCGAGWVTFSPRKGGAGKHTITLTTAATNRTRSNRSTSLIINSDGTHRNVTIVQSGKYALFNQKEYTVDAKGGTLSLSFKTNLTKSDDLQIMYSRLDWIQWQNESRSVTRAEQEGSTHPIIVSPNQSADTRVALFILALPSDDGNWMGLDTAYVSQTGVISDYESTDFTADGTVIRLQRSSMGQGIPFVLMGDGFTDRDVADSTYHRTMVRSMEHLFSEEPIHSLRDYFDVYAVTAVSKNSGVGDGRSTVFSTVPSHTSTEIDFDENKVAAYVGKVDSVDLERSLAIVIVNSHSHNGVTALLLNKQTGSPRQYAVSLCTLMDGLDDENFRLVLIHEAVGHGFAKLADEYGYDANGAPGSREVSRLQELHRLGWMLNVDTEEDAERVLWSPFIGDDRFTSEKIGLYEGAYTYVLNVYRPTENSMMRNNDSPFNAPSRKVIFDRIMSMGEERPTSTFDEFAAFDEQHKPTRWQYPLTRGLRAPWQQWRPAPPRYLYK